MKSRVLILGGVGCALALLVGAVWLSSGGDPSADPAAASSAGPGAQPGASANATLRAPRRIDPPPPSLSTVPRSLQDTEADGALRTDAEGNLVIDEELRNLFDYFLVATGEEPEENLRARVLAELNRRLPPRAAAQAAQLFDRYLRYRDQVADLTSNPHGADKLEQRLDEVKRIRREQLGPKAAEAIFGAEEAHDEVTLQRKRIAADPSLSEADKRAKLEALERLLPPPLQRARAQATAPLRHLQEEQQLVAAGATPEEVRHFREQTVGPSAAQRLEQMDREEAQFQARVQRFRDERAAMLAAGASLEQVRARMEAEFSPTERMRVITLVELQP